MDAQCSHRGRIVTEEEIAFICTLIARHPGASRRALSQHLCALWNWRQQNGAPREMVCRGLMLKLHRAGLIELPPVRYVPPNPLSKPAAARRKAPPVPVDTTPLCGVPLAELRPLEFHQVRRTGEEPLFHSLLERYHYLGYHQPVGEHLKYLVYARGRPIACLSWSSAPRHLGPRDRFIGWSAEARRRNLRYLAYNSRFLILPFVEVAHLASHLLGCMAKRLPHDWASLYGHPVYYLESFIEPERYRGTCYRAANWLVLGQTTGRGKDDQTKKPNRALKTILGLPLTKGFRERLSSLAG